jgi:hypothetical protein
MTGCLDSCDPAICHCSNSHDPCFVQSQVLVNGGAGTAPTRRKRYATGFCITFKTHPELPLDMLS